VAESDEDEDDDATDEVTTMTRSSTSGTTTTKARSGARAAPGLALPRRLVIGGVLETIAVGRNPRQPAQDIDHEEQGPPPLVLQGVGLFVFPEPDDAAFPPCNLPHPHPNITLKARHYTLQR
jgi:hypothetical protein